MCAHVRCRAALALVTTHCRLHVSAPSTEHVCRARAMQGSAQRKRRGGRRVEQPHNLQAQASTSDRPHSTAQHRTAQRSRTQRHTITSQNSALDRRSSRRCRPKSAEAVWCRAVVGRRGSARFIQTAEENSYSERQRSALEHNRTSLDTNTTQRRTVKCSAGQPARASERARKLRRQSEDTAKRANTNAKAEARTDSKTSAFPSSVRCDITTFRSLRR